jgi:conjugative relaxase-like TrwC/TraI family protein
MGLYKLTAGDGYTYLIRQVAALDASERGYGSLGDYYARKGESPGRWVGRGLAGLGMAPGDEVTEAQMVALFGEGRHPHAEAIRQQVLANGGSGANAVVAGEIGRPFRVRDEVTMFRKATAERCADWNAEQGLPRDWPVPAEERARVRTELAADLFSAEFGRPPADARELSGYVARATRQATTAVAGYDLTFSPVKSVSALWAVAPREIASQVEAAHDVAVADTLAWLEEHGAYTRLGHNSVRHVEVTGLIAAAFTHRDSRAGDPDLHTHVAVSNKVQTLDGKWRALDGQVLHKVAVAASERYNTRLEAYLIHRLGVRFAERVGTDPARRAIREVAGVDEKLIHTWSARRAAVEVRRGELALEFQGMHGRPPTAVEMISLAQQATLETRQAKHEPRSYAEQRVAWRHEATQVLGDAGSLDAMIRRALGARPLSARPTAEWVRLTAEKAVTTVQAARATWQECHLRAETERRLRGSGIALADLDPTVEAVVRAALEISIPIGPRDPIREPAPLRRRDGTSAYAVPAMQAYTSPAILAAEQSLLAAATRTDGRAASHASVDLALLESTANGIEPNPGQAQLARELATSPRRLQLGLAPAGTGKTTALGLLARAWTDSGGTVLGLAPSAAAASVLREEIGAHTDTIAKLLHSRDGTRTPPGWVAGIGPASLVIVDEASLASTLDLARVVQHVLDRRGSVRLVGDVQQLAAIGAGGVLRDIADVAAVATLHQVVRFSDPAEGAASLAVRAGDPAGLGYYLDHGRIHVGDEATVIEHAYQAWAADRTAGRDALMLAPTRELVTALNSRARAARLAADTTTAPARTATLVDGTPCSAGDVIIARRNERRLATSSTDWVKNGDRWSVDEVLAGGALRVTHTATRQRVTLPAGYVAHDVTLGYATTVHGAQGVTAGTCHTVATGTETRQLLYVALTRGRDANHVWLVTTAGGDEHAVIRRDALLPPTAGDILTRILARDGADRSATGLTRSLTDPAARLPDAADRYHDALTVAAEDIVGTDGLAGIDTAAETAVAGLTEQPAYPTLRAHLALLAVAGADVSGALAAAVARGELDTAHDSAAVLDWRMPVPGDGPLPWLPAVPDSLGGHPTWGPYVTARHAQVLDLADEVRRRAGQLDPTATPRWAGAFGDRDRALLGEIAVWRSAMRVEDTDPRPTGPARPYAGQARWQRTLVRRIESVTARQDSPSARWTSLAVALDPRIVTDPYWPQLAERLSAGDRVDIDVRALATQAAGQRPLPDEYPAAALWWRISRHLSPATLDAPTPTLRPDWIDQLAAIVGPHTAENMTTTREWPGFVASVGDASHHGWRPEQVLAAAHDLFASGQPDDRSLKSGELTQALAWRVALLTDPDTDPSPFVSVEPGPPTARFVPHVGRLVPTPYPELDPPARLGALNDDLAVARQAVNDAWAAYCRGQSPDVAAVMPRVMELRRRADELRPDVVDAQVARANWRDADTEARGAEVQAANLEKALTAARVAQDDERLAELEPLFSFASMSAANLRAMADHAHDEWHALDGQLHDKAGATGPVTDTEINAVLRTAEELDLNALGMLRHHVAQAEYAVFRAEATASRARGLCRVNPPPREATLPEVVHRQVTLGRTATRR